jgi:phosphate transport system permease protein
VTRLAERLLVFFSWLFSLGTTVIMCLLVGYLIYRGSGVVGLKLFFGTASPWEALLGRVPVWDGIWPAFVGTLSLVILAGGIAIPLGLLGGIYLAEYAVGRWNQALSYAVDVLAGIPSVLMGLFGFALIVFLRKSFAPGANTCLGLSAFCLALLVLPYMVRATQTTLEGLPPSVRMVGPALGFQQWHNIAYVLLPLSARGILSGAILSIGRVAEDTAVILLTGVVANAGLPGGLTEKYEALPFTIYYLAAEHRTEAVLQRAFGAALLLLALTAGLFLGAHLLGKSMQRT